MIKRIQFLFITLILSVFVLLNHTSCCHKFFLKKDHTSQNSYPADSISYTLVKSKNPNSDEMEAYKRITFIMDSAVNIYNQYTNITKHITVYYVNDPSVRADGNINGNIRFGPNRTFMNTGTAIHEISHTLGVGTSYKWSSLGAYNDSIKCSIYNGVNATKVLREIKGDSSVHLYKDHQHFWPFGINYTHEYTCREDLINHCKIVNAMFADGL